MSGTAWPNLSIDGEASAFGSDPDQLSQCLSNNRTNSHSNETNGGSSGQFQGLEHKANKKKKKSKNQQRQALSGGNTALFRRRRVVLQSTDDYPDIIIERTDVAARFAQNAQSSDEQWVIFVDGSAAPRATLPGLRSSSPLSSSSRDSSPPASCSRGSSNLHTPPLALYRLDGGASVAYKEGDEWKTDAFSLPDVETSWEAEVRGIEQGLQMALNRARNDSTFRKRIVVLTDCHNAMTLIAQHITGRAERFNSSLSTAAEAASRNARTLRQFGMEVKLLWSPAHLGIEGNTAADKVAGNARAYTSRFPIARALELAGTVQRLAVPYARRPPN
ncbi:hypothetical protein BDV10DRAFT_180245 [Aspergillus recurvatus]